MDPTPRPTAVADQASAAALARRRLEAVRWKSDDRLVLREEQAREVDLGWLFPWTSERFLASHRFADAPIGAGQILVDRRDGSTHLLDPHGAIDQVLERYRQGWPGARPPRTYGQPRRPGRHKPPDRPAT